MNAETLKRNPLMLVLPVLLTALLGYLGYLSSGESDNETAIATLETKITEIKSDIKQIREGQTAQNARTTDIWTAQKDDARLSAEQRAEMMIRIEAIGDQVTRIFEELRED